MYGNIVWRSQSFLYEAVKLEMVRENLLFIVVLTLTCRVGRLFQMRLFGPKLVHCQ